MAIEYKVI